VTATALRHCLPVVALAALAGCAPLHLLRYSIAPGLPALRPGTTVRVPGLASDVTVTLRSDGFVRIAAANETDLFRVHGYLMARDRMFQMDLLRHTARGELAALVGNNPQGLGTTVDADTFNRAMAFRQEGEILAAELDDRERAAAKAFAAGVNHWLATGPRALEHRLLGVTVRPWTVDDSMAVYRLLMFGLTHNYTRELRRLVIACAAGLDGLQRVWPTRLDADAFALPPEDLDPRTYPVQPDVVPEMAAALDALCPHAGAASPHAAAPRDGPGWSSPLDLFSRGLSASNNWVVAGTRSASGKPILANDPHLPLLTPSVAWLVEHVTPAWRAIGFTFPGMHRIVFGHNGTVAWGATMNNVDLQDLFVLQPGRTPGTYTLDGADVPFDARTEVIRVRGGAPASVTLRSSRFGVLINDAEPLVASWIPLTALRRAPAQGSGDIIAIRSVVEAASVADFMRRLTPYDGSCISWVAADTAGSIGYTSPCRVPVRPHHSGTFPVPGWLTRYDWAGFADKARLPRSVDPPQGWIATANNVIAPRDRQPFAYNNDPSPPDRWLRIRARITETTRMTAADLSAVQLDATLGRWPARRQTLAALCASAPRDGTRRTALRLLCDWDGSTAADRAGATVYTLLQHALLDRALADELPGGRAGLPWRYVQAIFHLETNVERLWDEPAGAPVWDDVTTAAVETREDLIAAAFADAVATLRSRAGDDPDAWAWGRYRPLVINHAFGSAGGIAARVFNPPPLPGIGVPEVIFKSHFLRSDREKMHGAVGPVFRYVVDLADPDAAHYTIAGGASGWPRTTHYGDLLSDWRFGRTRPLGGEPLGTVIFTAAGR
jgi:penicillin amidase